MITIGIACLVLASLVAILNIVLKIASAWRMRRGMPAKFTNVPFVSMVCGILAWYLAREQVGLWAFLPILLDPVTFVVLKTPWFLIQSFLKKR